MKWSDKQAHVIRCVENGQNILMTGSGGSGKSTVIRHLYQMLTRRGRIVQVCAMTGCASLLLQCNARTVHSFAGIGVGRGSISDNIRKILKNPYKIKLWQNIDVLIVDEVSMMSAKLFDTLDQIGRRVRRNPSRPFGGIQLVFSGDFFQLAPIEDKDDPETGKFCFESVAFKNTWDEIIALKVIYRQENDKIYAALLERIRWGTIDRDDVDLLMSRVGVPVGKNGVESTRLLSLRVQVDMINQKNLGCLETVPMTFQAQTIMDLPMTEKERRIRESLPDAVVNAEIDFIRGNMPCETTLVLKEGAQVMCVVNLDQNGLCNGSRGVVVGFMADDNKYPIVRFCDNTTVTMTPYVWASDNVPGLGISHIPLILAWALTIHKAQGATLDCAEIDVGSSIFDFGQTYVALSRVRSIDSLCLKSFDEKKIQANPIVQEFYRDLSDYEEHLID